MRKTWNVFVVLLIAGLSLQAQDTPSKTAATPSAENTSTAQSPAGQSPTGITPGEPLYRVPPKYPKEARRAKVQGSVTLNAVIGKDGSVQNIKLTCGDPLLVNAAMDAVRQWRYKPYQLNGEPVEAPTTITVNFSLSNLGNEKIDDCNRLSGPLTAQSVDPAANTEEGEVLKPVNGVIPPHAIYMPEPEYSKKARKAKLQGTVVLSIIINANGEVHEITVEKSLGLGLDEKAIEAVRQWRFEPAMKDGKPVAVRVHVQTSFHLYR